MAPGTAERPGSTSPSAAGVSAVAPTPGPAFPGRFGTRPLTRLARAACRMSDAAACTLIPLSCAACSRTLCDAGGSSNVTLVDLAI